MNVLYLLADDMRADLGSYGLPVFTPNIDALAESSLLFDYAYSQISVCSPSRQSFLTSLRPDKNKIWNFLDHNPKESMTTPRHFRDNGFLTLGLGKTYHEDWGAWHADLNWNTTSPGLPYYPYQNNRCPITSHARESGGQCILEDEKIYDYRLRLKTIEYLKHAGKLAKDTENPTPFFIMAGFRDPHAPWAAPQRFYDMYDEELIDIPPMEAQTLGNGTPRIAWSKELNILVPPYGKAFHYSYDKPLPGWVSRNQRRAYYASVSYVDEHIGAIVKSLKKEGLYNSTIIVFHSDHGYALGEHGYWEKKSNFDMTIRVPLLMHVPGVTDVEGYVGKTKSIFELVDVLPTLSGLLGLPPLLDTDGMNLAEVVHLGGATDNSPSIERKVAYHQFPACNTRSFNHTRTQCNKVPAKDFNFMGYSIRSKRWRYTVWYRWIGNILSSDWDGDFADELYDHKGDDSTDFDKWENINVSAQNPEVCIRLRSKIESFFRNREQDWIAAST